MNQVGSLLFGSQPFFDATGAPLASGYVKTTLAGSATLKASYSDVDCTTPNLNSNTLASTLRLDAGGFPASPMYFAGVPSGTDAIAYDVYLYDVNQALVRTIEDVIVPVPSGSGNATAVVLGYGTPTTLTIAGGVITPTRNDHKVSPEGGAADNLDTIAVTNLADGSPLILSNTNGSAPITVRNAIGNILTGTGQNITLSNTAQRNLFVRDGSNWYLVGSASAPNLGNDIVNGRLTVTSGTPVVASGTGTTVYFTPFRGNAIDLYDGSTAWNRVSFSEVSIAVPSALSKVYDLFGYSNAGVLTLETAVWTNDTTRATALTTQDGVLVKSGATTRRYLGTMTTLASSATIINDTPSARCLWNYYNRVQKSVLVTDTGSATSSYNTAVYRQANGNAANQAAIVIGVAEDAVNLQVVGLVSTATAADRAFIGLSIAAASPFTPVTSSAGISSGSSTAGGYVTLQASYRAVPAIGLATYVWAERGSASGAITWYYSGVDPSLINTGISGTVLG